MRVHGVPARTVVLTVVLLVLLAAPGVFDLSRAYAGWPAFGLAVAVLLDVPRGRRRWAATALVVLSALPISFSYGAPLLLGAVGALALALPALLVATHLLRGEHTRPGALVEVDSLRFLVVVLSGAALNSVLPTVVGIGDGIPSGLEALVVSFVAATTAQLVVLPQLVLTSDRPPSAGTLELWSQRLVLTVVFLAVFWPRSAVGLAFLVLPAIGWAAVRATQRETHVQTFLVCVGAFALNLLGRGPYADPAPDGLAAAASASLVYAFVLAVCFGTVPLALVVSRLSSMTTYAERSSSAIELMLESATGTLFIAVDETGRTTHWSAGAARTLGWTSAEMLGRSPAELNPQEEVDRHAAYFGVPPTHAAALHAMVDTGERRDWAYRHRDGGTVMVSLTISQITEPSGRVAGYIASGEDATERIETQRTLEAALERERESVLRLQEVDHVKQELVSNVSHELRTPITSISGYSELLSDGSLGELNRQQLDALARIERNTTRLGLLVEDLLLLSRAEAGHLQLERRPTDLRHVAQESYDLVSPTVAQRDLQLDLDVPDAPVTVLGDPDALERVVTNLTGNAIKFTPDGGRVTVTVSRSGRDALLLVSDTGIGISEEEQAQLFTRFFRSSRVVEEAIQGTGLGLSIVDAIVTRHGGTVRVTSAIDRGTRVTVTLPLA
ncbi:ATP-binding protein [Nocardioides aurantiacus]|uniref:Sensor-like histidine kinase SenX3 n=1 Tax=Nocardioides aurantiacus TaxID=86796 RepID=A0A3N2CV48_9ACTN|nr:ATP-binding protein [Nocardioides aurantiacus]ROR91336.1 hypothetical protein EDD33_2202 [Nocardioides aurantiacus]